MSRNNHRPKTAPKTVPRNRQSVRYDVGSEEALAVAMAKLGASSRAIQEQCKLTLSQITYRLTKAKRLEERDIGYRTAYRNGTSPEFQYVMKDYLAIVRLDVERRLPRLVKAIEIETSRLPKS